MRALRTYIVLLTCLAILGSSYEVTAQTRTKKKSAKPKVVKAEPKTTRSKSDTVELDKALALAREGQYEAASTRLFQLSLSPKYAGQRTRIRYLLGLMLYQMKMNQVAAFQFIGVIRSGDTKYLKESLEKLSLAADYLGDDTLLNYAIARVKAESFPAANRDMLFYRIGEFQIRNRQYDDAVQSLNRVKESSIFFDKALYLKGLALAANQKPREAVLAFEELMNAKTEAPITDTARVAALMGKARSLYQMGDWDGALEAYKQVPRDTEFWHDTLFEASWAMLRSGKFRSTLSHFQSLHSPYYDDSYIPESLLLRSIVYLYICQYEEMDKVLNLFNKIYQPTAKAIDQYLDRNKDPKQYFTDIVKVLNAAEKPNFDPSKQSFAIPYVAVRKIIKEGDFSRTYDYIQKLIEERRLIRAMPPGWRNSSLGKNALKTIERRIIRARTKAGRLARAHLLSIKTELIDLFEQEGFIRYEMTSGKREQLKSKVSGRELVTRQVNENQTRDYYIQNGYQYWTFRGEYWLDELGNYHYVGTQGCR